MFWCRLLPWEYGIRNLFRRPLRSGLTLFALTTVILLILVAVGFIRGLEKSLATSADPRVAIVFALGMGENLEYSSIPARTADLLAANLEGVQDRYGRRYVSAELYSATQIAVEAADEPAMGLVRGVTPDALLVHRQVGLIEGTWPGPGEVLVGRLAATKLGVAPGELAVGRTIRMEGAAWRISCRFDACGSVFGAEVWCRLDDLQQAMQRQDLSLVAVTLRPDAAFAEVDLFCKQRRDLDLQAIRETDYYAALQKDYRPVRTLVWMVVAMMSAAGVFAALNTMYGAVVGRARELATLRTLGFSRRAILLSVIQEGVILASAASLAAWLLAIATVGGLAVRFTMGAFELDLDNVAVLVGCGAGMLLGLVGAIPPAMRALRMPIVDGLKSV